MDQDFIQYKGCGLDNIYLSNGYTTMQTPEGIQIAINDIDGLHEAIGKRLITQKKDLNGSEIRFLRHELLMSQSTLATYLGITEQTVHRWELNKSIIPKSSERLLRLLYQEYVSNKNGNISDLLKKIANLEEQIDNVPLYFSTDFHGWVSVA